MPLREPLLRGFEVGFQEFMRWPVYKQGESVAGACFFGMRASMLSCMGIEKPLNTFSACARESMLSCMLIEKPLYTFSACTMIAVIAHAR
jgi:hypothetical protein